MGEDVDKKVAALVEELAESETGVIQQIVIEVQQNGEHPYRVITRDDDLPLVGVASTEPLP